MSRLVFGLILVSIVIGFYSAQGYDRYDEQLVDQVVHYLDKYSVGPFALSFKLIHVALRIATCGPVRHLVSRIKSYKKGGGVPDFDEESAGPGCLESCSNQISAVCSPVVSVFSKIKDVVVAISRVLLRLLTVLLIITSLLAIFFSSELISGTATAYINWQHDQGAVLAVFPSFSALVCHNIGFMFKWFGWSLVAAFIYVLVESIVECCCGCCKEQEDEEIRSAVLHLVRTFVFGYVKTLWIALFPAMRLGVNQDFIKVCSMVYWIADLIAAALTLILTLVRACSSDVCVKLLIDMIIFISCPLIKAYAGMKTGLGLYQDPEPARYWITVVALICAYFSSMPAVHHLYLTNTHAPATTLLLADL